MPPVGGAGLWLGEFGLVIMGVVVVLVMMLSLEGEGRRGSLRGVKWYCLRFWLWRVPREGAGARVGGVLFGGGWVYWGGAVEGALDSGGGPAVDVAKEDVAECFTPSLFRSKFST